MEGVIKAETNVDRETSVRTNPVLRLAMMGR